MRIGVDIDGCVRDPYHTLVEVYRREFSSGFTKGTHWCLPVEEWDQYDISIFFSIGKDIYNFWFNTHVEEIYLHSPAYSDFRIINELKKYHEIIILTNQPNAKTTEYTTQWIHNHIPYDELHFTINKYMVPCDIYLDDSSEVISQLVDNSKKVIIRDHGWNRDIETARVKSLTQFKKFVDAL